MAYVNNPARRSNLITPWGVGAIVPFASGESLMIAGLDMWYYPNVEPFLIRDERLQARLGVKQLRRPPDYRDAKTEINPANRGLTIPAVRFPRWYYCPYCGNMHQTTLYEVQPVCDQIQWDHGRNCTPGKRPRQMIPERFIVVCPDGHIDDFPIMEWVHNNPKSPRSITENCHLRRSTGGMSASLSGVTYECSCGAKRSMAGSSTGGALANIGYLCKGARPWLGILEDKDHLCSHRDHPEDLKVLQRGATNVWFGDIRSSIYIPVYEDEANRRIVAVLNDWFDMLNSTRLNGALNKGLVDKIAATTGVDSQELYDAAERRVKGPFSIPEVTEDISEDDYRMAEYNVLIKNSGKDNTDFYAKNCPIGMYDGIISEFFHSISLVHKLRETRALVGFTRLDPPQAGIPLADRKNQLRLSDSDWLPAIEVYGEGIFFEFSVDKVSEWAAMPVVKQRTETMNDSIKSSDYNRLSGDLTPAFVLIHTFAHLLINQLSYECGYGSASLRERIYCEQCLTPHQMLGVLIYTASGDSEGSLGGLVRQGNPGRIEDTILSAIENAAWCSSDPICIQSLGQGPDSCNLAACYNCALLPETSCEFGNRFLDRAMVVGTLDNPEIGFFKKLCKGRECDL